MVRECLRDWFERRCSTDAEKQLWPLIFHVRLQEQPAVLEKLSLPPSFSVVRDRKPYYLEQCRLGGMKFVIFYSLSKKALYVYGLMDVDNRLMPSNDIRMLDLFRENLFRCANDEYWPSKRQHLHWWDERDTKYPVSFMMTKGSLIPRFSEDLRPAKHYINAMLYLSEFHDKAFSSKDHLTVNAYMKDIEVHFCSNPPQELEYASKMFQSDREYFAGARLITHRLCARDKVLKDLVLKGTEVWIYYCFEYRACFEPELVRWIEAPNLSVVPIISIQETIADCNVRSWIQETFLSLHPNRPRPTKVWVAPWTAALDLVAQKLAFLRAGKAYLTYADAVSWLTGLYRSEINRFEQKDQEFFWLPLLNRGLKKPEFRASVGDLPRRYMVRKAIEFEISTNGNFRTLSAKQRVEEIERRTGDSMHREELKLKHRRRMFWPAALYNTEDRLRYRYFPNHYDPEYPEESDPALPVAIKDWIPLRREIVKARNQRAAIASSENDQRFSNSTAGQLYLDALNRGVPVLEAFMSTYVAILPPCMRQPLQAAYENRKHLLDKQRWLFFQFLAYRRVPFETARLLWKELCARNPNSDWNELRNYPKHFYDDWKKYELDSSHYKGGFMSCRTVISRHSNCCPWAKGTSTSDIEDTIDTCAQHLDLASRSPSYNRNWHSPGYASTHLERSGVLEIVYCEDDDVSLSLSSCSSK